ncbi:winged helix-turn-helix transcriptional regulator [Nocardioides piscis]|uniref:Winged helix-turn-helix transcriptional regulator n=1 Tax=Nocardioides piscis TaxID=2714938 RepID=A0A6G7YFA2_9ACTN|nr:winged helix-turn-helix transcriptional regulator [Nocardioides piscis]
MASAPRQAGARVRPRRAGGRPPALRGRLDWTSAAKFARSVVTAARDPYVVLVLSVQDVVLDPQARRAWRGDRELELSRKEFDLLRVLMVRAGAIVSRSELMLEVWETTFWSSSKTIDVHLGWLRRKLGDDPRCPVLITTVRGVGLRFEADSTAATGSTR